MAPEAGLGAIPALLLVKIEQGMEVIGKSGIPAGQESFTPAARELYGWASLLAAGKRLPGESPDRRFALRRSARASQGLSPQLTRAANAGAQKGRRVLT